MEIDDTPAAPVAPAAVEKPQPTQLPRLKGVAGIANIGNTCYANSTLQALRHTDDLSSLMMQDRWKDIIAARQTQNHETEFVSAYADLTKCLWTSTGPGFIRPLGFWAPMERAARASGFVQFCERSPQDSHEFMMFVLDMLHEGMKQAVVTTMPFQPGSSTPSSTDTTLVAKALEAWRAAFEKSYSPLVDMFFGLYLLTTTCQGCGKKSHRFDTFNCLKGGIEGGEAHTIEASLKKEMADEIIEGFDCPACSPARQSAKLHRTFWKLPQYLAVSIKRFDALGHKKGNPIMAPKENLLFGELFSAESPEPSRSWNYTPYSIVDHHGSHFGGHYTSQAYSSILKKWFLYDDEHAHELTNGPIFGSSTYIVFLRRA